MAHTEEPPGMSQGPITYTGRYPGYEPAQVLEKFFSAAAEHERPSYEERPDGWVFDGGGYLISVGCFVESDGTPVIALTSVSKSAGSTPPQQPFMDEFFSVVQKSAESTNVVLPHEEITDSGGHGTLRQLRPGELNGDAPNHVKDLVLGAVDHVYPGLREDVWPDFASGVVSEGEGVIVTYHGDRFQVATIVLTELQISTELLEGISEINIGLPIGSVFLNSVETGWCAIWKYKLLGDWLDPGSLVSKQMLLDILTNAPNITQMARQTFQAKECGGRAFTVEPGSGWGLITMSHV